MLGSITASGQQDLSRLERTWGESSPRPVEYWALVLAHDALLGGFWCEVRLFGLGFGVRCAVFGLDFGARCAVFGLDFGARCVVRRFWGRFRCTVRRFWARFWCAVRRFWARFWCAVCGAPILGPISVHGVLFWGRFWFLARRYWARFWCTVCGAPILGRISLHGAPCAFLGLILARCLFGIDFGAWCADVGVDHSQQATRSIKTWTFCFLALCWAPLSWPQNVVTTLFKTTASFLHA